MKNQYDVVIIGSGPNGLSAGTLLASKGYQVAILEASSQVGGALRTAELTLPGFKHDIGSAVHPMGYLSPYFKSLNLEKYGLEWAIPEVSVAHPLDEGPAVFLHKSVDKTASQLGKDANSYRRMITPLVERIEPLLVDLMGPFKWPKDPFAFIQFGLRAAWPASLLARFLFKEDRAKALFAGCAAHSILPFHFPLTSAMGVLFLAVGHVVEWPIAIGGSQAIARALKSYFEEAGGVIHLDTWVKSWQDLPPAKAYLFDTDPIQLADIATEELPRLYQKRLRKYSYGPGVFKIDYALSEPIPWTDPNCLKASTVHLGGTLQEIALGEKEAWKEIHSEKPYVLMAQQSQFDRSRAPQGQHTCWAYCHVPHGSKKDMSKVIESQIERFAPGFRDIILARHRMNTQDFYRFNPNFLGGAITGGAADITQLYTRPVVNWDPYRTPNPQIFIGSASTPPGGGVHGMCGYHAAQSIINSGVLKKK